MGIAQVFKLRTYTPLVPLIGGIIVCYSLIYVDSTTEQVFWAAHYVPFFSMFFELIISLITFIIAFIRKKKAAEGGVN